MKVALGDTWGSCTAGWDFQGPALTSVHDLVLLPQIGQAPQNLEGSKGCMRAELGREELCPQLKGSCPAVSKSLKVYNLAPIPPQILGEPPKTSPKPPRGEANIIQRERGNISPPLWPLGPGQCRKLPKAAQALFPIPVQQILPGSLSSPITHRYTDFAQDFLRNSFGFFQHLIQRAAILK